MRTYHFPYFNVFRYRSQNLFAGLCIVGRM